MIFKKSPALTKSRNKIDRFIISDNDIVETHILTKLFNLINLFKPKTASLTEFGSYNVFVYKLQFV